MSPDNFEYRIRLIHESHKAFKEIREAIDRPVYRYGENINLSTHDEFSLKSLGLCSSAPKTFYDRFLLYPSA